MPLKRGCFDSWVCACRLPSAWRAHDSYCLTFEWKTWVVGRRGSTDKDQADHYDSSWPSLDLVPGFEVSTHIHRQSRHGVGGLKYIALRGMFGCPPSSLDPHISLLFLDIGFFISRCLWSMKNYSERSLQLLV